MSLSWKTLAVCGLLPVVSAAGKFNWHDTKSV